MTENESLTMQNKGKVAWGMGRVIFLANVEQIHQLWIAGYTNTSIYQKLHKKLGGLSYSQFSHHLRKRFSEPSKTTQPSQGVYRPASLARYRQGPTTPNPTTLY